MFTKDKFLKDILELKNNKDIYDKSYDSIANNIMRKNIRGKEKAMGLDEYDSESLSNVTLLPGSIYTFMYNAETPTKYSNGKISFEYFDSLPVVLITRNTKTSIKGINLNLCTEAMRAHILNIIYNIDPEFFDSTALHQASSGKVPFSQKISKMLLNPIAEQKIILYIQTQLKIQNIGLIYRTYNIKKITNPRLIEFWQWKYVPFLNYKQTIKQDVLKLIYETTGMNRLRI